EYYRQKDIRHPVRLSSTHTREQVAWMECNGIREGLYDEAPDFVALHPGYITDIGLPQELLRIPGDGY
ncbi:MAG: hypothetical protein ABW108_05195, partial [Candidatus Thiodiazotropha sp. 6PLUC10]